MRRYLTFALCLAAAQQDQSVGLCIAQRLLGSLGLLVSWRMEEDVSGGGRLVSSGYCFNAEDSSRSSESNTSKHTLKARGLKQASIVFVKGLQSKYLWSVFGPSQQDLQTIKVPHPVISSGHSPDEIVIFPTASSPVMV
ncbi:hypothetical protein EYF80_048271 [Liparis tanakae]|uniref:Uncharacterized protein n=1 Tax=Liparis tanakae TaxID=230148 RepID=A0A4Z2FJZ6_9TELE|nr:hypothetical protein EYF80_048271 [Liparis tanakae]